MRRAVTIALFALLAAGCGDPAGRIFRTTVAGPDGSYAQEVVLGDQTGLVVGLEPGEIGANDAFDPPSVSSDPADPNTLVFRWSNGACDHPAISLVRSGDRYRISVNPRPSLGACMAILLFRAVRIRFSEAVAPAEVEVPTTR